jgi:hypothetical protein
MQGRDTQVADNQSGSPAGVMQSGVTSDVRNIQSYDVEDEVSPSSYYSSDNSQTSSALGRIIEYVNLHIFYIKLHYLVLSNRSMIAKGISTRWNRCI